MTCLLAVDDVVYVANLGDSRVGRVHLLLRSCSAVVSTCCPAGGAVSHGVIGGRIRSKVGDPGAQSGAQPHHLRGEDEDPEGGRNRQVQPPPSSCPPPPVLPSPDARLTLSGTAGFWGFWRCPGPSVTASTSAAA